MASTSSSSSIGGMSCPAATDLCFARRRCWHLRESTGLHVFNPLGSGSRRVLRLAPPNPRQLPYAGVTLKASKVGQGASVDGPEKLAADAAVHQLQADAVALGAIAADMGPMADVFFTEDDDELDLDCPSEGFNSIPEAIEDIRLGKYVIVVDDEDRENEGDLIMAASMVTPDAMAFIVRHGTGIVCVGMKEEDLERLELPLMVSTKENEEKLCTAFTVSVDVKEGTTTGVSAKDRAKTILALASSASKAEDFNRPGHIFPLKYREGGVLKRAGHTEASVDLAILAGLPPMAVLCEIVDNDDGSMARLPKLHEFAQRENLKIISIADLMRTLENML